MHCNHSHVLDGSDDIWVVMLVAWAGSLCTGGELLDRDETVSSCSHLLLHLSQLALIHVGHTRRQSAIGHLQLVNIVGFSYVLYT